MTNRPDHGASAVDDLTIAIEPPRGSVGTSSDAAGYLLAFLGIPSCLTAVDAGEAV